MKINPGPCRCAVLWLFPPTCWATCHEASAASPKTMARDGQDCAQAVVNSFADKSRFSSTNSEEIQSTRIIYSGQFLDEFNLEYQIWLSFRHTPARRP